MSESIKNKKSNLTKKQKAMLRALEMTGHNITQACKKIGITRETHYYWLHNSDEYKKRDEELQESLLDFAETMLMKKIKEGDTTGLIFFLKTKGKKRGYSERPDIEVNIGAKKIDKVQVEFIDKD